MKDIKLTEEEVISILWDIARQVATGDTASDDFMDEYCLFCNGEQDYGYEDGDDYRHEPVCIVIKARALIAQKGSSHD
jgi:hypothetical protein